MDLHDLTAAYALDALDADETKTYEAHLAQCEQCREELTSLTASATALAWAVDAPPPPAALRKRILAAATAERATVVPLPIRRPWLVRTTSAVAAVAACAAVGLGIWATSLSHSVNHERTARAADAGALAILSDPNAQRIPLDGGNGVVAVGRDGEGVLVVHRLAAAPSGKTYEAWVIPPGGKPVAAGLFKGGDGTTVVRLQRSVTRGSTVAATIERAGGVDAPTQSPVMHARA
jgi:anti-sigma-K factor RskA